MLSVFVIPTPRDFARRDGKDERRSLYPICDQGKNSLPREGEAFIRRVRSDGAVVVIVINNDNFVGYPPSPGDRKRYHFGTKLRR